MRLIHLALIIVTIGAGSCSHSEVEYVQYSGKDFGLKSAQFYAESAYQFAKTQAPDLQLPPPLPQKSSDSKYQIIHITEPQTFGGPTVKRKPFPSYLFSNYPIQVTWRRILNQKNSENPRHYHYFVVEVSQRGKRLLAQDRYVSGYVSTTPGAWESILNFTKESSKSSDN